jgi:hypothetical protein
MLVCTRTAATKWLIGPIGPFHNLGRDLRNEAVQTDYMRLVAYKPRELVSGQYLLSTEKSASRLAGVFLDKKKICKIFANPEIPSWDGVSCRILDTCIYTLARHLIVHGTRPRRRRGSSPLIYVSLDMPLEVFQL